MTDGMRHLPCGHAVNSNPVRSFSAENAEELEDLVAVCYNECV